MTYTIRATYYRKMGANDVHTYVNLTRTKRDEWVDLCKSYGQGHRFTGYSIQVLSYNTKGSLVKTVTTRKVFHKYVAAIRQDGFSEYETTYLYGNNLEQLVRESHNAIRNKKQAYAYIQETRAQREKAGVGVDIMVNNVSGVTRH